MKKGGEMRMWLVQLRWIQDGCRGLVLRKSWTEVLIQYQQRVMRLWEIEEKDAIKGGPLAGQEESSDRSDPSFLI